MNKSRFSRFVCLLVALFFTLSACKPVSVPQAKPIPPLATSFIMCGTSGTLHSSSNNGCTIYQDEHFIVTLEVSGQPTMLRLVLRNASNWQEVGVLDSQLKIPELNSVTFSHHNGENKLDATVSWSWSDNNPYNYEISVSSGYRPVDLPHCIIADATANIANEYLVVDSNRTVFLGVTEGKIELIEEHPIPEGSKILDSKEIPGVGKSVRIFSRGIYRVGLELHAYIYDITVTNCGGVFSIKSKYNN